MKNEQIIADSSFQFVLWEISLSHLAWPRLRLRRQRPLPRRYCCRRRWRRRRCSLRPRRSSVAAASLSPLCVGGRKYVCKPNCSNVPMQMVNVIQGMSPSQTLARFIKAKIEFELDFGNVLKLSFEMGQNVQQKFNPNFLSLLT